MIALFLEQLTLAEGLLLIGLAGVVASRVMDLTGKTRSSKILREENQDLTNRIRTLEAEKVERVAHEVKLTARIEALEAKVRDLESRDQAAVLNSLSEHEIRAQSRFDRAEEAASRRHADAMGTWERIATATEGSTS